jgi:hypothetical protein
MLTDRGPSDRSPDGARGDDGLDARERSILDFERTWWTEAGVKEPAIRERFALSATRYYQLLNELIDRDEALAYDPLVVRRLRRTRDRRRRARFEGRPLEERPGR